MNVADKVITLCIIKGISKLNFKPPDEVLVF